jgi:hypothetical protein
MAMHVHPHNISLITASTPTLIRPPRNTLKASLPSPHMGMSISSGPSRILYQTTTNTTYILSGSTGRSVPTGVTTAQVCCAIPPWKAQSLDRLRPRSTAQFVGKYTIIQIFHFGRGTFHTDLGQEMSSVLPRRRCKIPFMRGDDRRCLPDRCTCGGKSDSGYGFNLAQEKATRTAFRCRHALLGQKRKGRP